MENITVGSDMVNGIREMYTRGREQIASEGDSDGDTIHLVKNTSDSATDDAN